MKKYDLKIKECPICFEMFYDSASKLKYRGKQICNECDSKITKN